MNRRLMHRSVLLAVAGVLAFGVAGSTAAPPPDDPEHRPPPWGAHGHELTARAAATGLPADMPAFFRERAAELEYLNPEPDRWRDRDLEAMDEAFTYDHYVDVENLPVGALDAPDRWSYLRALYAAGLERPERDAGFLPYRILELYQRVVTGFRLWREAPDRERPWIENRIVNDAGVLGHYVSDASQPHHTTIHFNGWDAEAPNPEGFTLSRDFHGRFESAYVDAAVTLEDLLPRVAGGEPPVPDDMRAAVTAYIMESHHHVPTLYELERDVGFDPDAPAPATTAFAVERLVAAADMLRTIWWSAWIESGR